MAIQWAPDLGVASLPSPMRNQFVKCVDLPQQCWPTGSRILGHLEPPAMEGPLSEQMDDGIGGDTVLRAVPFSEHSLPVLEMLQSQVHKLQILPHRPNGSRSLNGLETGEPT